MTRSSPPLAYLDDLRPAFVAHLADRLNDTICRETQIYADRLGIQAPVKTHSALLFLHKCGPASLTEIAARDGQSHQLLAARLGPLESLGLIERFDDPSDGRRRPYRLTRAGQAEARRVEEATRREAAAMQALFDEMGVDLNAVLEQAIERLRVTPLTRRIDDAEAAAQSTGNAKRRRKRHG
jgi:DNA-binding MarR family transcriptional regulator